MAFQKTLLGRIKKYVSVLVVLAMLASAALPGLRYSFADGETEEPFGESTASPEVSEQETPEPDETAEPTEEPSAEPTPEQTPDTAQEPRFAEDGTEYLYCGGNFARVCLNGTWTASRTSVSAYEVYGGALLGEGEPFTVPGFLCDGSEALILEKIFYISGLDGSGSSVMLTVNQMMYDARIFVNGAEIGGEGLDFAHTAERLDITGLVQEGDNTLTVVLVCGGESVYGVGPALGICGDVILESCRGVYIDRVLIDPDAGDKSVKMRISLSAAEDAVLPSSLSVNVFELGVVSGGAASNPIDVGSAQKALTYDENGKPAEIELTVDIHYFTEDKLWSSANPFLYKAVVNVGGVTKETVFGISTVTVEEDDFYVSVNGKRVFLAGITLDHRLMATLNAVNEDEIRSFVTYLKKLGVNTVKGRGVVFSPLWHRICDELGVFLISEYPLGVTVDGYDTPYGAGFFAEDVKGFVEQCYNSPSCIIWDLAGEDFEVEGLDAVVADIRELDGRGRPLSIGLSEPPEAGFAVECDVSQLGGEFFVEDLPEEEMLLHSGKAEWNLKEAKAVRIATMMFGKILTRRTSGEFAAEDSAWWTKTLEDSGTDDYGRAFARILWLTVEHWRTARLYGGIILPCEAVEAVMQEHCFEGGAEVTSENRFVDGFSEALKNGFAPIGVYIESCFDVGGRGESFVASVAVTNNTGDAPGAVEILFTITDGSKIIFQEARKIDNLNALGSTGRAKDVESQKISFTLPKSIKDGTELTITAQVIGNGDAVSRRTASVFGGATYESPYSETVVIITVVAAGAVILVAFTASLVRSGAVSAKKRKREKK